MTVYISYPGEELELFANAHVWKDYWTRQAAPFLGARVFDVGSGAGGNLPWLAAHGTDWTCIEPDRRLAEQLKQNLPNAQAGQKWRMEGVTCYISQVGKTLVNYKLLKDNVVRAPNSLGTQVVLAKHLAAKQAVLMRG